MNPPPNPAAAVARADMQAYNEQVSAAQPKERKPLPLYPLSEVRQIWVIECNDCGCSLWIDDPEMCFAK